MNLVQYDIIGNKIDKTKTWVDVNKKILYSREIIPNRPYYTFANKYDAKENSYYWYIILIDNKLENGLCFSTNVDDYGRTKLNLKSIYNKCPFRYITKSSNIDIERVDEDSDGDVYRINF